ncbi:type IX secretion system plug protein [Faecalibacter rhinopitheci]|nr:type IX secretion system plug protein domain-containing protein [Faecalibacter rhinopitheci]
MRLFNIVYITILCLFSTFVIGQTLEILPPKNITTVQVFNPQKNDNTAIIRLGSNEYLLFLFDDLEAGYKRYNYKIEHRNADWSESNIFESEYVVGLNNDYVRTYKNSFNTYKKFTNYQIQFPNKDMNVKLGGNYLLKVYTTNEDQPIFTKRFAVYQGNVDVGMKSSRYINPTYKDINQRIQTVISSGSQNLTETPDGGKLFIMKNNNWNEHIADINPDFTRSNQLTYNNVEWTFEGGGEYNWFDTKNLDVPGLTTERNFRKDSVYHTVLRVDFPKYNLPYDDYGDVNGNFYIRNNRFGNEYLAASEADYSWVYFALDAFEDQNGLYEPYVVGAFNNWEISPQSKLKYNPVSKLWENEYFLKQGYYNYQYVVVNTKNKRVEPSYVSGSFWQTENLYQGLFYYRPWGGRYDILMGYGEVNTRN